MSFSKSNNYLQNENLYMVNMGNLRLSYPIIDKIISLKKDLKYLFINRRKNLGKELFLKKIIIFIVLISCINVIFIQKSSSEEKFNDSSYSEMNLEKDNKETELLWQEYLFKNYKRHGYMHQQQKEFNQALEYFKKALNIYDEIRDKKDLVLSIEKKAEDKKEISELYEDIGFIYLQQRKFKEALKYYDNALIINQDINNKEAIINCYNNLGVIYQNLGQYEKAFDCLKKALRMQTNNKALKEILIKNISIIITKLGQDMENIKNFLIENDMKYEMIIFLRTLGDIYFTENRYKEAIDLYNQAIAVSKECIDKEEEAIAILKIGEVYQNLNETSEAMDYFKNALNISQNFQFKEIEAISFMDLGIFYMNQREYEKALSFFNKAVDICKEIRNKRIEAKVLLNIGITHCNINNKDEAKSNFEKALKKARELKDISLEADCLYNIGYFWSLHFQYSDSVEYLKAALDKYSLIDIVNEQDKARCYLSLGYSSHMIGQYLEALNYYQDALEIYKKINNKNGEIKSLTNISRVYLDLNLVSESFEHSEKAFNICNEFRDIINKNTEGENLLLLGDIYYKSYDFKNAKTYYSKARIIFNKSDNKVEEARSFIKIGDLYLGLFNNNKNFIDDIYRLEIYKNKFNFIEKRFFCLYNIFPAFLHSMKAKYNFNKALLISQDIDFKRGECAALCKLGLISFLMDYIFYFSKEPDQFQYFEKASIICEESGFKEMEALSNFFRVFGYLIENQNQQAQDSLNKAKAILNEINYFPPMLSFFIPYMEAMENAGKMDEETGPILGKHSIKIFKEAREFISSVGDSFLPDEYKIEFFQNPHVFTQYILQIVSLSFEWFNNKNPVFLNESFQVYEEFRSRVFLEQLSRSKTLDYAEISPKFISSLDSIQKEYHKWNLEYLIEKTKKEPDPNKLESLEAELSHTRQRLTNLKYKISHNSEFFKTEFLSIEKVQQFLTETDILLSYHIMGNLLWIITKENVDLVELNINGIDLAYKVYDYIGPIWEAIGILDSDQKNEKTKNSDFIAALEKFDLQLSHELFNQLIAPVGSYLKKKKHIIIIPDFYLYYLPFETLLTKPLYLKEFKKKQTKNHRKIFLDEFIDASYLIKEYQVSYLQSASLLPLLKTPKDHQKKLLAFVNSRSPVNHFSNNTEKSLHKSKIPFALPSTDINISFKHYITQVLGMRSYGRLRYNISGARSIAQAIGSKDSVIFLDANATETRVKTEDLTNYDYIHFSCHGISSDKIEGQYIQPCLFLVEDEHNDGILYMSEILSLNMDAKIVTLAACETGLGELKLGEGIIGLTRSFMYAGTPSVVVSLWKVNDESTSKLMINFYKNLNELPKGEALQKAKIQLFGEESRRISTLNLNKCKISYAHPFFWAPFILYGKTH